MKLEQYLLTVVMKYSMDMNIEQKVELNITKSIIILELMLNDKYNKIHYFRSSLNSMDAVLLVRYVNVTKIPDSCYEIFDGHEY